MSVQAFVRLLRAYWKQLLVGAIAGSACGWGAGMLLPSYYRAQLVVAPAADPNSGGGGLSALASQFGGLASLAGVSLGGAASGRSAITLETLRGQSFLIDFARRRDLVVPLFAAQSWNKATSSWNIDPDRYDEARHQWRDSTLHGKGEPSDTEIYKAMSRLINIDEDRRSGVIRIVVESKSPQMAARWGLMLVEDLNNYVREADAVDAKKTIEYLQQQIRSTQVAEMQSIFYRLIEDRTKSLMLAQVTDEYALKVIDRPLVPDRRAWPSGTWLLLLGALGGFSLVLLVVLFRLAINRSDA